MFRFSYRHIKHLVPDRFINDRIHAQTRPKEQSRSLPRIPISVSDFIRKIHNFNYFFPFVETKSEYQ